MSVVLLRAVFAVDVLWEEAGTPPDAAASISRRVSLPFVAPSEKTTTLHGFTRAA